MIDKNEQLLARSETIYYHPVTGEVMDRTSSMQRSRDDYLEFHSVNGDKRAPNGHDFIARLYDYPKGNSRSVNSSGKTVEERFGAFGSGLYSFSFKGTDDEESALYNSALSELNKRAQGGMDLSTDILEYHQVVKMFKGAGSIRSYLGNTIRAAQSRGKRPTADTTLKQLVRDAGGNWLQWKLGLSPLLGSFHDIVKEVNTSVVLKTMRVEAKRVSPIVVSGFRDETPITQISSTSISGKQGVHFRVQFRPVDQFPIVRWVSLNPVGWAWELIPLSFVFDYFLNVGDFLRNSEIALAYNNTFDSGYVTYLYAYGGGINTSGSYVSNDVRTFLDLRGLVSVKRFRRQVLGSWPFPRQPTFQSNLGSGQMLTIAALLSQLLHKR